MKRFIHFFVGIGAMAGGLGAVLNPDGPMGMSTEVLKNGPFTDFLIPGLFLLLVLGVGNVVAGCFPKPLLNSFTSLAMGGILALWIIIQCWVMQDIVALHLIFFGVGALQVLLGVGDVWRWFWKFIKNYKS